MEVDIKHTYDHDLYAVLQIRPLKAAPTTASKFKSQKGPKKFKVPVFKNLIKLNFRHQADQA